MSERGCRRRARWSRATVLLTTLCVALAGVAADRAASAAPVGSESAPAGAQPGIGWRLDGPLLAAGASLMAVARSMDAAPRLVPPGGLDPGEIHWSFDRAQIGHHDTRANDQSDYTRDAAMAYPLAVAFLSQSSGTRCRGTLRRAVLYTEATVIAGGICAVIKNSADRPRPFTYLPVDRLPDDPAYDVTAGDAFRSMPSGHSSGAFCGAAFAMTDHLLSRPEAGWLERAGVPFGGGLLAGMTATMRVKAGKHFPSDVIAGGLVGTVTGVAVPLAHHYSGAGGRRAPLPSASAWGQATAGLVAGIGVGILVAEARY